jgi:hypothetical protein
MKSVKFLAVICAVITVTTATTSFAQVKNFEGPSVYFSTGYDGYTLDLSNYSGDSNITWDTFKPSVVPLNIGAGYTWALGEKNTIGIEAQTNVLKSSTATAASYYKGTFYNNTDVYIDSYYDLSLVPGFLISKDTLLYGKLGYFSARVVNSSNGYTNTGYSYGIGAKTLFNAASAGNNFYLFGELKMRAGNTTTLSTPGGNTIDMKVGGTSYLVGVGMNF